MPKAFAKCLDGHDVDTARNRGWEALKNGALLDQMSASFDVLVTVDKNLRYQQNPTGRAVSVVVLTAASSRLAHLMPLVPALLVTLAAIKPGEVQEIGAAD